MFSERGHWRSWIGPAITAALTVVLLWLGWMYTPAFWPEATITQPGPIETDVRTSDGFPVVFFGDSLHFEIAFCNPGVDITEIAWLDSYNPLDPAEKAPTEERQGAYNLFNRQFFFDEELCIGPIPTNVRTASAIGALPDGYYKFRGHNMYSPNFLLDRVNVTETEIFYLATEGREIP